MPHGGGTQAEGQVPEHPKRLVRQGGLPEVPLQDPDPGVGPGSVYQPLPEIGVELHRNPQASQERVGSPLKIAAARVERFTESVIREMTRLADEHKAINLAQGFPDFDAPEQLKEAAIRAIQAGVNQYPVTWGSPTLRGAIATKYGRFGWPDLDPETEIVVT